MFLKFRLTEKEFASLSLQMHYRKPTTLLVLFMVPVYIGYILKNVPLNDINQALPLAILPFFVLVVLPLTVWHGAVRTFRTTPALAEEMSIEFTDEVIKVDTASQSVQHRRSELRRIIALRGAKVLMFGPGHLLPLPNRVLSAQQLVTLQSMIKR